MNTEYEGKFPDCTSCGGKGSCPCSACTGGDPDCDRCEGTNHETCAECEHREGRIRHWRPDEVPEIVRDESVPLRITALPPVKEPTQEQRAEERQKTLAFWIRRAKDGMARAEKAEREIEDLRASLELRRMSLTPSWQNEGELDRIIGKMVRELVDFERRPATPQTMAAIEAVKRGAQTASTSKGRPEAKV